MIIRFHIVCYRKSSVTPSCCIVHFVQLSIYWLILVIKHTDDGHKRDRNMLLKNNSNMWLNVFISVHLLVHYISIKHSLIHGHGTHKATDRLDRTTEVVISASFLDVRQRTMAVPCASSRVKHQTVWSLKMGRITFSRNVGTELPFYVA
jgi:hypothetical protein